MSDFSHVAIFNRLIPYRSSDAHASLITREGDLERAAPGLDRQPKPLRTQAQAASSGAAPFLAVAVVGADSFTRARRTSVIAGYAVTET